LTARRRLPWVAAGVLLAAACAIAATRLWDTQVPDGLHLGDPAAARFFSPSFLERAEDYERFLLIDMLLSTVALLVVLAIYAQRGAVFVRESAAGRVGTGMLLAMLGFGIVWLTQLPFGVAALWWERRHDVSEMGYLEWAVNSFLALGGEFVFICLAIGIVMGLAGVLRDWWWVAAAPIFVGLALLSSFVSPFLIPDLRSPDDKHLEAKAREYERVQGLPEIPVKVEEVKEFTDEPNAFATGLGSTRRVILWDTLVDGGFNRPEVDFVLAHELAHHSRNHLWKLAGWFAVIALPLAFVIALATRRRGGMYAPQAVPLAIFALVVLQLVVTPAQNAVVRNYEQEADWVGLQTTCEPGAARASLQRLARKSLSDPDPPGWSVALLQNHPPIIERIAMANAWPREGKCKNRRRPVASVPSSG
jgi:STE24 endopeptidase